jgi:hypothetical protein
MAKKKRQKIDRASLNTLNDLMAEMETKIKECQVALDTSFTWAGLQRTTEDIYELASAVKEKLPGKGPESAAKVLCRHAFFMKKYAYEKDRDFVESNFRSLRIDFKNAGEDVSRLEEDDEGRPMGFEDEIAAIGNSDAQGYLNESCQCLSTGAYRASVVMSGCSLESLVRLIYKQAKGHDSSKLTFARVVEILEGDKELPADQAAIVGVCRVFRNLTGHPLGFRCSQEEAESLLRLAVAQLRKSQEQGDGKMEP